MTHPSAILRACLERDVICSFQRPPPDHTYVIGRCISKRSIGLSISSPSLLCLRTTTNTFRISCSYSSTKKRTNGYTEFASQANCRRHKGPRRSIAHCHSEKFSKSSSKDTAMTSIRKVLPVKSWFITSSNRTFPDDVTPQALLLQSVAKTDIKRRKRQQWLKPHKAPFCSGLPPTT